MATERNPFSINFGIIPTQYISRSLITDEIIAELENEIIQTPCFMLTGIRGSGKTVTMTSIEKEMKEKETFASDD